MWAVPYKSKTTSINLYLSVQVIKLAIETGSRIHYVSSISAIPARTSTNEEMFTIDEADMEDKGGYVRLTDMGAVKRPGFDSLSFSYASNSHPN